MCIINDLTSQFLARVRTMLTNGAEATIGIPVYLPLTPNIHFPRYLRNFIASIGVLTKDMKKALTIIVLLAIAGTAVAMWGSKRAALMVEINDAGMYLVSDTANNSGFKAKLYELAYSSPVAPEKVGLWMEAVLANDFETFSTKGLPLTPELVSKLEGWPLNRARELDFSGSALSDSVILDLGKFPKATWINFSHTKVTEATLEMLSKRAPNIRKLQLNNTPINWSEGLVKELRTLPDLKEVEWNENSLIPDDLDGLVR